MSCLTLFPENKKILPIWTNVWSLLMPFGLLLYGIGVGINNAWQAKEYHLHKNPSFGALFGVAGLVVMLVLAFWDFFLYSTRVNKPIRKAYKSLVVEERIDEIHKARGTARGIVAVNALILFFVILAAVYTPLAKHEDLADATLKKIPAMASYNSDKLKYGTWSFGAVIFVLGIISLSLKHSFDTTWKHCLQIYPERNLSYLISDRPGLTQLWAAHLSALIFFLPAIAATGIGLWIWKDDLIKGASVTDFQADTWFFQTIAAIMVLFLIVVVSSAFSNSWKGKKIVDAALSREISDRDTYELGKVRKAIQVTSLLHIWLLFCWVLAVTGIVFMAKDIKFASTFQSEKYFTITVFGLLCLMSLSTIPILTVSSETISRFRRCNDFDYGRDLILKFENIDF
ncbi:hypothetical protein MHSWG343_10300 [Candidatus Mycoplasma haematohominis]|uniref:Uncharacterized protein n=1 Tax=Candidatus Mycoplasma haematohominis TaxID=1494318 RepID=A0A478FRG7_9MOLU|nr:hypothetical protein MHSWG343_10300 [Candidatus Mycoplasma haemohominis]